MSDPKNDGKEKLKKNVTLLFENVKREEGLKNEEEGGGNGVEQSSDKRLFQGNRGLRRSNPSLLVPCFRILNSISNGFGVFFLLNFVNSLLSLFFLYFFGFYFLLPSICYIGRLEMLQLQIGEERKDILKYCVGI